MCENEHMPRTGFSASGPALGFVAAGTLSMACAAPVPSSTNQASSAPAADPTSGKPSPATSEEAASAMDRDASPGPVVGGLPPTPAPFDPFVFLGVSTADELGPLEDRFGGGSSMGHGEDGSTILYLRHEEGGERTFLLSVFTRPADEGAETAWGAMLELRPGFDYAAAGVSGPMVDTLAPATRDEIIGLLGVPNYYRDSGGALHRNEDPGRTSGWTVDEGLYWMYPRDGHEAHVGLYFRRSGEVDMIDVRWDPAWQF